MIDRCMDGCMDAWMDRLRPQESFWLASAAAVLILLEFWCPEAAWDALDVNKDPVVQTNHPSVVELRLCFALKTTTAWDLHIHILWGWVHFLAFTSILMGILRPFFHLKG